MNTDEDMQRLESELEHRKEDLREDVSQIESKIHETREELSPSAIVHRNVLPLCAAGAVLGFLVGYFAGPFKMREAAHWAA